MSDPFADRALMARAALALGLANLRYWSTVAPLVRAQLERWEQRARRIPDERLQALACEKLREERFNVEAAATLATLATRARRGTCVRAIVALQTMYDYLDLLTEQPLPDPIGDGGRLYSALTGALAAGQRPIDCYPDVPGLNDGGYLKELAEEVRLAVAQLPAWDAVAASALAAAERCVRAQLLTHAAARAGSAELKRWAQMEAAGTGLDWPQFLAGATASVLVVHVLIAAAAAPRTTPHDAQALAAAYLAIGALTMLDSLVDRDHDLATGELGYTRYYTSEEHMAANLGQLARAAVEKAAALPDGPHHVMTLVGIVAYYGSSPAADSPSARPAMARLRGELAPLIVPTLAVMRAWRLAKRIHN